MSAIDQAIDQITAEKNDAVAKMEWWRKEAERWRNQALDLDAQLESSLIVQLGDAKATADLWIQKAKQADEAAADLITVLANARRHWREETEEQARLLGMSAERECDLRGKLERERALADRLGNALEGIWPFLEEDIPHGCNSTGYMNAIELCRANITAWKEARSE